MNIQKIQKNNTNFYASLKLTGHTEDISKETIQIWKNKAKNLGNNNDLIKLHFGTLMTIRRDIFTKEKSLSLIESIRAIYASAKINGKVVDKNRYIGYKATNKPHSEQLRDKNVLDYLDKLV